MPDGSNRAGASAALACIAGTVAMPFIIDRPNTAWLISGVLLICFCMAVGVAINDRINGLVIDNRNRVSLSKFQALCWSIIVLSAFLTAAIVRLKNGAADAANIIFEPELLAAMGISAASLVATPVVLSLKSAEAAPEGKADDTARKLGDADPAPAGKVYARKSPEEAKWLDMFRGEEVSNAASPDLSKIQQFLITVVVLIVYSGNIWNLLGGDHSKGSAFFGKFPEFSPSLVWLIGISHAGYIAYKAAPHGQDAATAAKVASSSAPDGSVG